VGDRVFFIKLVKTASETKEMPKTAYGNEVTSRNCVVRWLGYTEGCEDVEVMHERDGVYVRGAEAFLRS
jgi:hypothetical protein